MNTRWIKPANFTHLGLRRRLKKMLKFRISTLKLMPVNNRNLLGSTNLLLGDAELFNCSRREHWRRFREPTGNALLLRIVAKLHNAGASVLLIMLLIIVCNVSLIEELYLELRAHLHLLHMREECANRQSWHNESTNPLIRAVGGSMYTLSASFLL